MQSIHNHALLHAAVGDQEDYLPLSNRKRKEEEIKAKSALKSEEASGPDEAQDKGASDPANNDIIMYAWLTIVDSMTVTNKVTQTMSKMVQNNAELQEQKNKLIAELQYKNLAFTDLYTHIQVINDDGKGVGRWTWVKKSIKASVLDKVELDNQGVSAQKNYFSNQLQLDRQTAQTEMGQVNLFSESSSTSKQVSGSLMDLLTNLVHQVMQKL